MNINVVVISGNLGRNPELRFTNNGSAVCEFSIAHNEVRGTGDDRKESVHWIQVVAFGPLAQTVATHKNKGDEVLVQGRLAYSEWTDKDGNTRRDLKVKADHVQFGRRATAPAGDEPPVSDEAA